MRGLRHRMSVGRHCDGIKTGFSDSAQGYEGADNVLEGQFLEACLTGICRAKQMAWTRMLASLPVLWLDGTGIQDQSMLAKLFTVAVKFDIRNLCNFKV